MRLIIKTKRVNWAQVRKLESMGFKLTIILG